MTIESMPAIVLNISKIPNSSGVNNLVYIGNVKKAIVFITMDPKPYIKESDKSFLYISKDSIKQFNSRIVSYIFIYQITKIII